MNDTFFQPIGKTNGLTMKLASCFTLRQIGLLDQKLL